MNIFKRKALFSAVLAGAMACTLAFESAAQYTRQNAARLVLALVMVTAMALGLVDPATAGVAIVFMGPTNPFPVNPVMTAVAIGYRNPDTALIADAVLPRTPPLATKKFKYLTFDQAAGFTVPDTKVGRKSEPNVVEFGGSEVVDETADYGLDDIVPNDDIEADNQGVDPRNLAVMNTTALVQLDREVRVANKVFAAATYPAANKVVLAGVSQWSDPASDPLTAILTAMDGMLVRPNIIVVGRAVFTKLVTHSKIVQAIRNTAQGAGKATARELAELLEVQEVLIGEGWVNTAKKGQPAAMARCWGKHAALLYRNRAAIQAKTANNENGVTFGFTAQFGDKVAGSIPEPKIGLRGAERVRVGESVKEVISASDTGYFFQNAVA